MPTRSTTTLGPSALPRLACLALLTALCAAMPLDAAQAQAGATAVRLHAAAVEQFRLGRFPAAYGRFVALANAGHPPSAALALWMCAQGPTLFGSQWDCTPDEVVDWTALARRASADGASAAAGGPDHRTAAGKATHDAQRSAPGAGSRSTVASAR